MGASRQSLRGVEAPFPCPERDGVLEAGEPREDELEVVGDRAGEQHRVDARVEEEHAAHAEREEQCVSLQEHVWGTDGLAKLEAIKAKLDPQGIFQCQKCVGFKGPVRDQ